MKRTYLLFTISAICLFLSACHNTLPESELPVSSETSIQDSLSDELNTYCIESKDAFLEYANTHSLPKDFVGYEQVAVWGEVEALIVSHVFPDEYMYSLRDANNFEILLRIEHNKTPFQMEALPETTNASDLRLHPDKKAGEQTINGLAYRYNPQGELLSIVWQHNGITFTLTDNLLSQYPITEKATMLQKLLIPSKAAAAVQTFNQQISNEMVAE